MRLRNVKNKDEIIDNCDKLIKNPKEQIGNWKKLFGNNNSIYIEIGMGKGNFIIENAARYPNINFIGIEKYSSVIARAIEKVSNNLPNLLLIRMDAIEIEEVFSNEISRIYLNFSDPWPKKRNAKRRLTSEIFLDKYENIFKDSREIIQKTDNRELFEYSIISLVKHEYKIEDISLDLHNSNIIDIIMTEYENKFVENNKIIYYLVAKK